MTNSIGFTAAAPAALGCALAALPLRVDVS
jgi:hypothetical protein